MYVLVRDARAFSCVGSGVDDLRLVHSAGPLLVRVYGAFLIRRLLVLVLAGPKDQPRISRSTHYTSETLRYTGSEERARSV